MQNTFYKTLLIFMIAASPLVMAHDPSQHAQEQADKSAAPDCSKMEEIQGMEGMAMPGMDPQDPVYLAMMEQCQSSKPTPQNDKESPTTGTDADNQDQHGGHH